MTQRKLLQKYLPRAFRALGELYNTTTFNVCGKIALQSDKTGMVYTTDYFLLDKLLSILSS